MKLTILLAGVSLLASEAVAGNVSNVPDTLDITVVDPAPSLYPHFVCASGCSGGAMGGSVTQSGAWTVGVTNFPSTQAVTGSVSVSNLPATQPVTGTINVGNFPSSQAVTGSVAVPGVATAQNQPALDGDGGGLSHITNWPASQTVNGAVAVSNLPVTQTVSGTVSVGNFPFSQTVTGSVVVPGVATADNQPALDGDGGGRSHVTNWPASQTVSGSVAVSNLPASQAVTGTVSVGNFPSTQTVSGSVTVPGVATAANQPGLGADGGELAHITNWPTSQPINGSVAVSNLPATQPVSGTISVGNFPTTQAVSGSAGTSLAQGAGTAGPASLNVYVGGGVGVGPPSSSTQTAVAFFEQTTPAGVPIDPTAPLVATSTNTSGTVTAANTFQALLAASTSRKGCAFQDTSSDVEYIDVGDPTGSATKVRSYQVQPGSYWYCSQVSGLVISDLLSVTAPNSGDTFVLTSQ